MATSWSHIVSSPFPPEDCEEPEEEEDEDGLTQAILEARSENQIPLIHGKICNDNTSGRANLVFYELHAYNNNCYMREVLFVYGLLYTK